MKNNQLCVCPTTGAGQPKAPGLYDFKDWWSWESSSQPYPEQDPNPSNADMVCFGVDLGGAAAKSSIGRVSLAAITQPANCVMVFEDHLGAHVGQPETYAQTPGFSNLLYADGHVKNKQGTQFDVFLELVKPR